MRRLLLVVVLCLLAGSAPRAVVWVTYESITVAATAVGLAPATINPVGRGPMVACSGRLETGQVRFRYDNTDPTSAEGIVLEIGDFVELADPVALAQSRFIRTTATSGVLKVHCWR